MKTKGKFKLFSSSFLGFFTPLMLLKHHQRIPRTWLVHLGVGKRPLTRERGVGGTGCQYPDVLVGRDCKVEGCGGIICLQADELEGVSVGLETTGLGQQFEVFLGGGVMAIFPHEIQT